MPRLVRGAPGGSAMAALPGGCAAAPLRKVAPVGGSRSRVATSAVGHHQQQQQPANGVSSWRCVEAALVPVPRQQQQRQQRPLGWRSGIGGAGRSRDAAVRFREDDKQQQAPSAADAAMRTGARQSRVPVILKFGKRCNFGEAFAVVGSAPELGSWDPARAVKMRWTPGDVWVAHVQLPVDTEVQYKYVRVNKDGAVVTWEGADAGNGGAAGPMGNLNLNVRPGHRVIWGHGVEVYTDLPPEYADFAGSPLPGTSAVTPSGGTSGRAREGGSGGGTGVLSSVKETARGALAALESAITGGHAASGGGGGGGASGPAAATSPVTTSASSYGGGTAEGPTPAPTTSPGYGTDIGVTDSPYPSFSPAPGVAGTTIGDVAAAANAPATTHDRHTAPAAGDYSLVDPAVPHISSTDLAATLIAAGPAAAAVSAAALGLPGDESGSIPVVTPVASPASAAEEIGSGGVGVGVGGAMASATPPPVTLSGAPADQVAGAASGPSATPGGGSPGDITAAPESGPGNNGTGESSGGGARRLGGFFRK